MALTKIKSGGVSSSIALDSPDINTPDIDGGTIDGTVIGGNTAAAISGTTGTFSGEITANGGIALADSDKATFGASDDLQIYHDGTNSYVQDAGTGNLNIKSNGSFIDIQSDSTRINNAANNEIMATFVANGAVTLNYDNASKLATTSTGISVTGGITTNANSYLNGLRVGGADTGNTVYQPTGNLSVSTASGSIFLKPSGTTALTATATGIDVGGKLTVSDGGNATVAAIRFNAGLGISNPSTDQMNFITADTTRMVIDNSGNVLVGKDSNAIATAGAKLGTGGSNFTRSGNEVVYFNRTTNDGAIATFAKDGTTVGSIGTYGGTCYMGGSGTLGGFMFNGSIEPTRGQTRTDAAHDLGSTAYRFKDLYLSGGVYLGGTGAANKLSDVETGTWTPTSGVSLVQNNTATYTKIGRLVHINFDISVNSSSSGSEFIMSLPFTHVVNHYAGGVINYTTATNVGCMNIDGTVGMKIRNSNLGGNKNYSDMSGHRLIASVTYRTNA